MMLKVKRILISILAMFITLNILQIYNYANAQVKVNGIYKMAVGKTPSKVIEVKGADKNNNAIVDIWDYGNALQQQFYFEYQKEGYYKITAMHTGKSLTAKNNKIAEGVEIVQNDFTGLDSQKWVVRDSNKNGWVISPLSNTKLAISIAQNIKNGEKLVLSKTEDNDKQMFYLYDITKQQKTKENGIYKIAVGKNPSKTIEVKGADLNNNAIIDIWDYGNASQQKFYLEYQQEGFYKISSIHIGKCLTVKNNKIAEGMEIVQNDYQGLDSQKWIIRDSNKNGWIISPLSNASLSISIAKTIKNGEKLILSKTQDNDMQMMYMFNITNEEQTKTNGMYKIAVGKDPSKIIEVLGGSSANNASIDIWTNRKCRISKI